MSAARVLVMDAIKGWVRAKGVWLVVLAALVPPLLTGSWALTHQDDVSPVSITFEPARPVEGDIVNITAVVENVWDRPADGSNATLEVGYFEVDFLGDTVFRSRQSETFQVPALQPGQRHEVNMSWTATGGTFIFQVRVDVDDAIAEVEENNNHRFVQVQVAFPEVEQAPPSPLPENATGLGVDLAVTDVSWAPRDVHVGEQANITVTVENRLQAPVANATVLFQALRGEGSRYSPFPSAEESRNVSLGPGESTQVTIPWSPGRIGQYALLGAILPPANTTDANPEDNLLHRVTFSDRGFLYEEPEPKATAKTFYFNVLEFLHIRLLIPLIALFYAGSALEEERRKGNLAHILTRPVPRWLLPVTNSLVSFAVVGAALAAGVLATFVLLLGLPQEAPGFLAWPLAFTLLALFAYGGLWSLVGVATARPTMWGLLYVLGVETVILVGRAIIVNGQPLLQPWALKMSLAHWMTEALRGWDPAAGAWQGGPANVALAVVAGVGLAGTAAAAWWMGRREFPQ